MTAEHSPGGQDLRTEGVPIEALRDGIMLTGTFDGDPVVLLRRGPEVLAFGGSCTHYGGPLGEGVFDGACVRCPWHHARFDVATGDAVAAPALDPIATYEVVERDGRVFVTAAMDRSRTPPPAASPPSSVVIVGAGAAGNAAAEMLRRAGYPGPVTMLGIEDEVPYDRPNLSKDYLAGRAEPDWIPLRSRAWYAQHNIELLLGHRGTAINLDARSLTLDDGRELAYGALLLATGAEPVRLDLPGAGLPHVHVLRSLGDSNAIIAGIHAGMRAVVIGTSFIGLEVAAALRDRDVAVHVVGPDARPLERVLGPQLGDWIRVLHESHGVEFHFGRKPAAIDATSVTLDDGSRIDATLVVMGVGVRPRLALPATAGLADERDVPVNEYLETRGPGVWAAGDIARVHDRWTDAPIRVEHWVVAERQGQVAARNILGRRESYTEVPFFWSQHYDVTINYVGHAERWGRIDVTGNLDDRSAAFAYRLGEQTLAVATVGRDTASLEAELAMERGDEAALRAIVPAGSSS